jgi:hypothetical protein
MVGAKCVGVAIRRTDALRTVAYLVYLLLTMRSCSRRR